MGVGELIGPEEAVDREPLLDGSDEIDDATLLIEWRGGTAGHLTRLLLRPRASGGPRGPVNGR